MSSATATTTSTGWPTCHATEQDAFLAAHPDLYERSHGAVRVRIRDGLLQIGSLGCVGFRERRAAGLGVDEADGVAMAGRRTEPMDPAASTARGLGEPGRKTGACRWPAERPDGPARQTERLARSRLGAAIVHYLPSLGVMIGIIVLWEAAVVLLGVKEYILPTPSAAFGKLFDANYQWTSNFLATLWAVLGAFALSAVLGILLAVVIVWNDLLLRTVMPVLVLFNTLPKIALAPLFVVWLGYGIWPNIVIGTTIAFFPMVVNTAVGLASAEPEMLDLVRTLRANRWQVLRKIRFPNAIPYIFTGLKLNATMSVIGALVGEFVASERGLGSLIITGGVTLETAGIFASLILISAMGLALYGIVVAVENVVAPWGKRT